MIKPLVKLFVIKLYVRINIFKHIKKKHGQDLVKVVRDFEQKKTKFVKLNADFAFIKLWKKEKLIPTFAKVYLYEMANSTYKLKRKIAPLVMEAELQNKHSDITYEKTLELLTYYYHIFIGYSIYHLVTPDKYSS